MYIYYFNLLPLLHQYIVITPCLQVVLYIYIHPPTLFCLYINEVASSTLNDGFIFLVVVGFFLNIFYPAITLTKYIQLIKKIKNWVRNFFQHDYKISNKNNFVFKRFEYDLPIYFFMSWFFKLSINKLPTKKFTCKLHFHKQFVCR